VYRFYRSQVPFLNGMIRTLGELPIRPPQLDGAPKSTEGRSVGSGSTGGSAASPRSQHSPIAPPATSEPIPCEQCGYDLRGSTAGSRCPECGTPIPKVRLVRLRDETRRDLRADFARSWNQLGFLALPPALLLSPIPCLLPFGVGAAVALGFAPAFRVMALRSFDTLPDELRAALRETLARLHRVQRLEFVCVGLIAIYALLATFGGAPRSAWHVYFSVVLAWWCIAAAGVGAQVQLGQQLATWLRMDLDRHHAERARSERATERERDEAQRERERCEVPDDEETAKLLWQNRIAFLLVVAGAMLSFGATALASIANGGALSTTAKVVDLASNVTLGGAFFVFGLVALKARAHADLVALAVHGSRLGRVAPLARPAAERSASSAATTNDLNLPPDWKPPSARPQRRDAASDDDAPIPLA
jgi:hypothetical protein